MACSNLVAYSNLVVHLRIYWLVLAHWRISSPNAGQVFEHFKIFDEQNAFRIAFKALLEGVRAKDSFGKRDKNSGGIVAYAAWNVFAADQNVLERRTTTAAQSRPQQPIEVEDQSFRPKQRTKTKRQLVR